MADGRVINVVEAVAAISFVGMKEQKAKEGRKKERRKGPVPLLSSTIYILSPFSCMRSSSSSRECSSS